MRSLTRRPQPRRHRLIRDVAGDVACERAEAPPPGRWGSVTVMRVVEDIRQACRSMRRRLWPMTSSPRPEAVRPFVLRSWTPAPCEVLVGNGPPVQDLSAP